MRLAVLVALGAVLLAADAALAWETITPHRATAYVVRVEEGNLIAVSEHWRRKTPWSR